MSTNLPKDQLAAKRDALEQLFAIQSALGSYNTREGNVSIRGTGSRGEVSACQALIAWSRTPKGIAALQAQATERKVPYVSHLAQSRNRWNTQLQNAQSDIKMFEKEEARLLKLIADIDIAHPTLKPLSLEDIRALLSDTSEDDTSTPAARLAVEASTQDENDAIVDELARANS